MFQKDINKVKLPHELLDDALKFHGLTRDKMVAEVIRWLPSLRLESPSVYNSLVSDPPEIKHKILRYDFVFSTGLTIDAPKRRGWTDFMAIREFIQNVLDVEERIYGYENIAINIYQDKQGIHILDRGPGITYDAFRIGASDKAPYERGYFGEGLKMAAAHLVGRNCLVYAFNKNSQVFKVTKSDGLVLVLIGVASEPLPAPYGTEVIIYGARLSADFLDNVIFQRWIKMHPESKIYVKYYGEPSKPNIIVTLPTEVDTLWVRDILVNKISTVIGKKSIFGYNLWWVNLEPNRVMVASPSDFYREVARAHTKESIIELLNRIIVDSGEYSKIKDGYLETDNISWFYASKDVREAVAEYVANRDMGVLYSADALNWVLYMRVRPLMVPYSMRELFSEAQTAESLVRKKYKKIFETIEKNVVPREFLTFREIINLRYTEELLIAAHTNYLLGGTYTKFPEILVYKDVDVAGTQPKNKIYINRAELSRLESTMSTVLHEYSHWVAKHHKFKGYQDLTEGFEEAMSLVAGCITDAITSPELHSVLLRIYTGGWNAKYLEWNQHGEMYIFVDSLFTKFTKYLKTKENIEVIPPEGNVRYMINTYGPIALAVPIKEKVTAIEISTLPISTTSIIPDNFIPNREIYMSEVKKKIKDFEYNAKKIMLSPGVKGVLIFIYDPWEDDYVEYKRYQI